MSFYPLTPRRVAVSQVFIVLYSGLAAVLGRGWMTFAIILVLIVALALFQARRSSGPLGVKARPEDVEAGKKLYEEESIRELQIKDEGLARDFEAQSKALLTLNLALMAGIVYFIIFWRFLDPLTSFIMENVASSEIAAHFLAFLIYLEGYFVVSTIGFYLASKRMGALPMINMPSSYLVTDRGIVYKGLLTKTAIPFPLPGDVEVRLEEDRRFVELVKRDKRSIVKIRLYARNPKRLYQVIRRYGVAGSGGESRREAD